MTLLNRILLILIILFTALSLFIYFSEKFGFNKFNKLKEDPNALSVSDKTYYFILAAIIIVGVLLRVWKFGSVPGGFNQDGAMAAVDGKALADYGTDRFGTRFPAHLYAWGYSQMSSLLSYMIAIFVKLFGLNRITARLPLLIASLAGGAFFYLFIRDIFGKKTALIAAAFVAINPWHLAQSRWALEANLLPHFFMGGLYFLNRGLCGKTKSLYVSMVFFGLSMYCYGITIYTIPVFLVAACIFYLAKKRLTIVNAIICAGIYLLIAWPFILTMAINFFKWDTISLPFVTMQRFSESIRSKDILLFSDHPIKQLIQNTRYTLNNTLLQKKDVPWNYIEGFGTMFLFSIPFMAAGAVELFRTKTKGAKGLVSFALLIGIWTGLFTNYANINRLNIIYYGIMMFIVLGISFVCSQLKKSYIPLSCIYIFMGIMLTINYFGPYSERVEYQFYSGFGESFTEAIDSGAQHICIGSTVAQNADALRSSEALTLFYDKTDALYFQGKTNENNGKQLLPYKQRFIYRVITRELTEDRRLQDTAYVVLSSETHFFDKNKYTITNHGRFSSVIKK